MSDGLKLSGGSASPIQSAKMTGRKKRWKNEADRYAYV